MSAGQPDLFGANAARERLALEQRASKREAVEARRSRRGGSATSRAAAAKVDGKAETIRARVHGYAAAKGGGGFTDDDLRAHFGDAVPESSYRKRRTELAQDGVILDTGRTQANRHGVQTTVWVHKDFAGPGAKRVEAAAPSKIAALRTAIGYHVTQARSYVSVPNPTEGQVASARYHLDKIKEALS